MEDNEVAKLQEKLQESVKKREDCSSENIKLASQINYKNFPEQVVETDQFGFVVDNKEKHVDEKEQKFLQKRENARMEKWNEMMKNFESFYAKDFEKLKSRTRKGIPDCFRGYAWQYFGKVHEYLSKEQNKGLYAKLISDENSLPTEDETVILRDLDRTFPKHTFFKDKYGLGQRSLYNVLRAYAKYNVRTGYVQGMGFIVALFLTYMDEEASFWLLHSLMEKYNMEGYYLQNFPELPRSFYKMLRLVKKLVPKVFEHLSDKKRCISPSMYAPQWFITVFSVNFKFDTLVRIFDVFLCEGIKVVYRLSLSLFKVHEEKILKLKYLEDVMNFFKTIYDNTSVDELFEKAFDFSISRKDLERYEKNYDEFKSGQRKDYDDVYEIVK